MNELVKTRIHKPDKNLTRRLAIEVAGICINVLLAFICHYFHLSLYMDTIGTILVASLAGALPGIVTAVATSFFCSFFNQYSLYYVLIGVLIAMCVSSYVRNEKYKKKSTSVLLIMLLAFIGGGVGTLFQWLLGQICL